MTININPIIGKLGPFTFRWYGVIMAVAVLVGLLIFSRQLDEGHLTRPRLGDRRFAVPCGVIGARLFHVLDNFSFYWHHPGQICRRAAHRSRHLRGHHRWHLRLGHLLPLEETARCSGCWTAPALAFPVAQIIGRCANIINGDTWGPPTKLPWGFTYTNPNALMPANLLGVPTQPTPVYEQLWLLVCWAYSS